MRILLLGADGQVGTDLREVLSSVGEIKGTVRDDLNLKNFDAIRDVVRTYDPNVIVNAAAYTAVDNAENEFDLAHSINGEAVGVLAQEAKDCGAW